MAFCPRFMAKISETISGMCGMFIRVYGTRQEEKCFFMMTDKHHMSEAMKSYVAGTIILPARYFADVCPCYQQL